jgi:MoaA/NifB/PqqE/SkfB family radical SAM enzyme
MLQMFADISTGKNLVSVDQTSRQRDRHALALFDVQQIVPEVVTPAFNSIASLMNGGGPRPTPGGLVEDDDDAEPEEEELEGGTITLAPGTVIRQEAFGGIIYHPSLPLLEYVNRPAFALLSKLASRGVTPLELGPLARNLQPVLKSGKGPAGEVIRYSGSRLNALNYPITATIELTYSCHHACRHCMNMSSPKHDRAGEKTPEYWENLIVEMRSRGLFHVYFSGGEIIRYKGYKKIFDACDRLGVRYLLVSDLAGHTEADFLNLRTARNLDTVRVSLDGHDESTHDFMRGRGAFEATLRGIRRLQDDGIHVGIYHSVHRRNLMYVEDFLNFCLNIGIRSVLTGVACAIGRGETKIESLKDDECVQLSNIYLRYVREGFIQPVDGGWMGLAREESTSVFQTWRDFVHGGTHRVHLTPNGAVRICPKLEKTCFARFGVAENGGVEAAWHSPRLDQLREWNVQRDGIVGTPLWCLPC